MTYSKSGWIVGGSLFAGTCLGLGLLLFGDLNEDGVREGGFLTPTAYEIMKNHHKFTSSDEKELKELAKQNPQLWKEVSQKIKDIPNLPLHKRMDVLYPIYKGKNAQFPKKIIGDQGQGYYLDLSYNIHFDLNPYCFYVSPYFKEMVSDTDWFNWQISCAQSIVKVGTLYGNAWKKDFPVSASESEQIQETLKQQMLSGDLSWYKQIYPFGYVMNETNEYIFSYPSPKFDWYSRAARRTKYASVMRDTHQLFQPLKLNGEIIGKMPNGNIYSIQNGKESLLFFGIHNDKFFKRLSMLIVKLSKEPKNASKPLENHTKTIQDMIDWTKENENSFQSIVDDDTQLPEFKRGIGHIGELYE